MNKNGVEGNSLQDLAAREARARELEVEMLARAKNSALTDPEWPEMIPIHTLLG